MNILQSLGLIMTLTSIYITTFVAAYGAKEGSGELNSATAFLFVAFCIGIACIFMGSPGWRPR